MSTFPRLPPMTVHNIACARELDSRSSAGIDATLFWHPGDDRLWVAVNDRATGDSFTVDIRAGDRALDVLRHPHAHAVARRSPRRAGCIG